MEITRVIPHEIDAVMSLIKSAIQEMEKNGIFQWDDFYHDRNTVLADINSGNLYALKTDALVAGIIALNENQSPEYRSISWSDGGHPLVVHRLCIIPSMQGRGLAKYLMKFAEDYARNNNYSSIRLDAFTNNKRAVGLYDSLNYHRRGIVRFRKGDFYCFEKYF